MGSTGQYMKEIRTLGVSVLILYAVSFWAVWSHSDDIILYIIHSTSAAVIVTSPMEAIQTKNMLSVVISAIVCLPVVVLGGYRFTSPALTENEKKYVKLAIVGVGGSMLIGGLIGVYSLNEVVSVLNAYNTPGVTNMYSEFSYVTLVVSIVAIWGVMSCIPVAVGFLTYIGVIDSSLMTRHVKQFIVISMIAAGVISPGADVFSMLLVEMPIIALYAISIIVSWSIGTVKVSKGGENTCSV